MSPLVEIGLTDMPKSPGTTPLSSMFDMVKNLLTHQKRNSITELIIFAGNLTVHKQHSHEGLKRYSCDLCPFKSNSVFSLKNHAVLNHDLKVKLVSMGLNHIGMIVWFFPLIRDNSKQQSL